MKSLNLQNDAILSLTRLFTQPLDLPSLLERILEVDAETLQVARVSIWLYDADHKGIELLDLFESATGRHTRGGYLSKADYPGYFAAIERARVLGIDDVSSDPATVELFEHYLSPLAITSMLDSPIIVEGQSRGVVCHEHVGLARVWDVTESAFAASIADLVGQAIQTDELRRTRAALLASQQRAELMFSSNPVALLLVDRDGAIKEANQKAAELFQCDVEDLHNASVEDLIPSHLRERHVLHRQSFNAEPSHRTMASTRELLATTRAGAEIPVEVGLCPITIDGSPHVICAMIDISARKAAESRLRVLSTAIEQTPATVMITDADGVIEYVNPQFTIESGYSPGEVVGQSSRVLSSGLDCDAVFEGMWRDLSLGKPWVGELINRDKQGNLFWEEAHFAPVSDDHHRISHYVGIKLNITDRKANEARLRHQALFDSLTGLPNRILLNDRLRQSMASAKRNQHQTALMFVDLDHFKQINDTHGHDTGDLVLQEAAQRMKRQLRDADTIARIGGDEFVTLLPEIRKPDDALRVGNKLIRALRDPIDIPGVRLTVTCSIGIALYPRHAHDEIELYRYADQALYAVKNAGRNGIRVYSPSG